MGVHWRLRLAVARGTKKADLYMANNEKMIPPSSRIATKFVISEITKRHYSRLQTKTTPGH